jgi:RimJ/RimL family protein N-acetyltransferase
MLDHLAQHYAVTQCLATADARNERSWRLLERLGFRQADGPLAAEHGVRAGDWLYLR